MYFFNIMICHQVDQFRQGKLKDFIPCIHFLALKEWNIACQLICCYISPRQRSWVSIIISQASNRKNNLSMLEKVEALCHQKKLGEKELRQEGSFFYWSVRSSPFRIYWQTPIVIKLSLSSFIHFFVSPSFNLFQQMWPARETNTYWGLKKK